MTEPLLATVGSIGRFHTFDLAYELQKRGHLAAVYSGYPKRNFRNTRVDPRLMRCFPWIQTPLELASRCGVIPQRLYQPLSLMAHKSLARYIARTLPPCHVLSMLSGTGLEGGRAAQARNIAYVCRRGSAHIAWQDRILREEHELLGLHYEPIHPRFIEREQEEYQLADAITVPSSFSLRSFLDMGIDRRKLHLTPYGVDLRSYRRICPREDVFRVLFVGALSIRKGLHCLLRGFARARLPNARLILVGAAQTETANLLNGHGGSGVDLLGPAPRDLVVREMSRASVLVLPSLEDGFGRVLAEALACGCPVIASTNTGAEDLFSDGEEGFIVPVRDPEAIADRLTRLYEDRVLLERMSDAALARVRSLGGWDAYGRESIRLFCELARARGHAVADPVPPK